MLPIKADKNGKASHSQRQEQSNQIFHFADLIALRIQAQSILAAAVYYLVSRSRVGPT